MTPPAHRRRWRQKRAGRVWTRSKCNARRRVRRWPRHRSAALPKSDAWMSSARHPPTPITPPKRRITLNPCRRCSRSRNLRLAPRSSRKKIIGHRLPHPSRRPCTSRRREKWTSTRITTIAAMTSRPRSRRVGGTVRRPSTAAAIRWPWLWTAKPRNKSTETWAGALTIEFIHQRRKVWAEDDDTEHDECCLGCTVLAFFYT